MELLPDSTRRESQKRGLASLNTEVKELRAQLKRTSRAADAASAASSSSQASLVEYQAEISQRIASDGENWRLPSQVTHSPRLRTAVFAMALGLQSQSLKGPVGWQSQSQAVPQPS